MASISDVKAREEKISHFIEKTAHETKQKKRQSLNQIARCVRLMAASC